MLTFDNITEGQGLSRLTLSDPWSLISTEAELTVKYL